MLQESIVQTHISKAEMWATRQDVGHPPMNGTFFDTHRMLGQYVSNAYFPADASVSVTNQVQTPEEEPVLV